MADWGLIYGDEAWEECPTCKCSNPRGLHFDHSFRQWRCGKCAEDCIHSFVIANAQKWEFDVWVPFRCIKCSKQVEQRVKSSCVRIRDATGGTNSCVEVRK